MIEDEQKEFNGEKPLSLGVSCQGHKKVYVVSGYAMHVNQQQRRNGSLSSLASYLSFYNRNN